MIINYILESKKPTSQQNGKAKEVKISYDGWINIYTDKTIEQQTREMIRFNKDFHNGYRTGTNRNKNQYYDPFTIIKELAKNLKDSSWSVMA